MPLLCALCLQVKLLEAPGLPPISIAEFLGKAVEAPLQQAVTSAIQVRGCSGVCCCCCRGGPAGVLHSLCCLLRWMLWFML